MGVKHMSFVFGMIVGFILGIVATIVAIRFLPELIGG